MHYLQSSISSTLVATPSTSSMLPEVRHLDIPWKEFYCRTITKTSCTSSLGLESSLSARDTYILSLHARTRETITPRSNRGPSRPSRISKLPPSTSLRAPSPSGTRLTTKRFRREGNLIRLQKAVLMKNSFVAAARDYDARGNGFAAEKQRKRAMLPQRYIDKIAEQDDPRSWTFPPSRINAIRRDCAPTQKSTLASVCFSNGIRKM